MNEKRLTIFALAVKNLSGKPGRTAGLIILVTMLCAVLFAGSMLLSGVSYGIESMAGRFGADMMIVPRGSGAQAEDVLLRSEAGAFYLPEDMTGAIGGITGVEKCSPQLFVQSLDAACCSVPVQLIGFAPGTDFNIQPWIIGKTERDLQFGEVVIGDLILAEPGDEVVFFDQPFRVAARMDKTGMGFDSSIFMTMETAWHMVRLSMEKGLLPYDMTGSDISSIMVKLNSGADMESVRRQIIDGFPGADVLTSSGILTDTASRMGNISALIYMLAAMIFILCLVVLILMFSVTINERRSEFALFRAQGATRRKLSRLILTESLLVSVVGTVLGLVLASMVFFPFAMFIGQSLDMPFLTPTTGEIIACGAISAIIAVITGPISCLRPAVRIGASDAYVVMREN